LERAIDGGEFVLSSRVSLRNFPVKAIYVSTNLTVANGWEPVRAGMPPAGNHLDASQGLERFGVDYGSRPRRL